MAHKWTRRQILTGATLAAAGAAAGFGRNLSALAQVALHPQPQLRDGDTLVVLFLRGGADGLNIVVPHGDEDYYRLRPTLALAKPNDRTALTAARSLDLNGFFGLHPALAPLLPLYQNGQMAVVHAVGSGDQTRSHFEAMATMERGVSGMSGTASGWLARHLTATAQETESPLRTVAVTDTMPDSLRGATNATVLQNLAEFRLTTGTGNKSFHAAPRAEAVQATLGELYGEAPSAPNTPRLDRAGKETLAAMEAIRRLDPAGYRPAAGAKYPAGEVGNALRQVACLLKGEVGLEVACVDMGGWDTHVAQGRDAGWQPLRLAELGGALGAFAIDLGARMERVTVVVMTEFGRRAYENTGAGTDHGRASCLFLLGGGLSQGSGGRVYGEWPGLAQDKLDGPGDLRVTTDYRDVLAEVLERRLKNTKLDVVFPGYTPEYRRLFA